MSTVVIGTLTKRISSLTLDELVKLRDRIDATLDDKVASERKAINARLLALTGRNGGSKPRRGTQQGSKIAPKYRNPANPSETWAGRGLKPRWLTAAMKGGKKLEHFAISATSRGAKKARRGKAA
jgi:DNA-binding protein H-NS